MRVLPILFLSLSWILTSAPWIPAQDFLLVQSDGGSVTVRLKGFHVTDTRAELEVTAKSGTSRLPLAKIISLHGAAPRVRSPIVVTLVGGDEWTGSIAGGDDLGNHLSLRTEALGARQVPVDRLAVVQFRERSPGAGAGEFAIPAGIKQDEALFTKAERGFDVMFGALDRFATDGVHFVLPGRPSPRLFRYDALSGIGIRDGDPAKDPGDWLLITSTGDRLRVRLTQVTGSGVGFATEFGVVQLPFAQVASLTQLGGDDRRFLSDLEPVRVEETGSEGDLGGEPLFAYRRDRTVSGGMLATERSPAGGFLVAGGRTWGKGLGVHSRSILTYRVPEGMHRFQGSVAIDDEVKALGLKGDVDVVVRSGDKILYRHEGLRRGAAAESLGTLAVEPGALLTLEVGFGKGMFLGDRVDWLGVVFLH